MCTCVGVWVSWLIDGRQSIYCRRDPSKHMWAHAAARQRNQQQGRAGRRDRLQRAGLTDEEGALAARQAPSETLAEHCNRAKRLQQYQASAC